VSERLAEHEVNLAATDPALDLLAEQGYDPEMGARPLRRVIQGKIEDPLSDALLSGEFHEGDTIQVDVEDGEAVLKRTKGKTKEEKKAKEKEKAPEPVV
jgi:ATP-dependent Clp protease ATP-binding subunit ClpC